MSYLSAKTGERPLTVGELRDYLDEMESHWTEEDTKYLGEFRHLQINMPHHVDGQYVGIGHTYIYYDGGLDFVIEQLENKERG